MQAGKVIGQGEFTPPLAKRSRFEIDLGQRNQAGNGLACSGDEDFFPCRSLVDKTRKMGFGFMNVDGLRGCLWAQSASNLVQSARMRKLIQLTMLQRRKATRCWLTKYGTS